MIEAKEVLPHFGIQSDARVEPLGSGHIHKTYRVSGPPDLVLQRVNKNIFTKPDIIAANNRLAFEFIRQHHPEYRFPRPLPSRDGQDLWYDNEGFPWRVVEMIDHTFTMDEVANEADAYEAASGFAQFTKYLNGVEVNRFRPTLDRFHDLAWRYEQFTDALRQATHEVTRACEPEIEHAKKFAVLVREYEELIRSGDLTLRITHNDTKVNNVLFDQQSRKAVCAIDLDTLMPGYFIYDLGDMVRTCVSPMSEEEKDLTKIQFRRPIYEALLQGYLHQMGDLLTAAERNAIPFAGQMMTYIMALRFLADYLRGNTYYHITYADQNLVRARNQFQLLSLLREALS